MPRGGYREKAGRKSGWIHRETQVIRVPVVFAEELMEIAKRLDEGKFIDSVTESEESHDDSVTESKFELVTESLKHILSDWRKRADQASPGNADWRKARQMLSQLEPVVYNGVILDSVIKSKESPGQMSLLDQNLQKESVIGSDMDLGKGCNDSVTESEESAYETVTDSKEWLSIKECWEKLSRVLEKPPSYNTFRKLAPEKFQRYGIEADLSKREKPGSRWLRFSTSNYK